MVNFNEEWRLENQEEEQKWIDPIKNKNYTNPNKNTESEAYSEIFKIKDITRGKTNNEIKDLIKYELGTEENDSTIWEKMIKAISSISLNDSSQSKGIKSFHFIYLSY